MPKLIKKLELTKFSKKKIIYCKQIVIKKLFKWLYEVHSGNKVKQSIKADYDADLLLFKQACQFGLDSSHESIQELSCDLLYDLDAIFRVFDYPECRLTNNEAERALHHLVINAKVSLGSQSDIGGKVLGILASIISACQVKCMNVIHMLCNMIANFRIKGKRGFINAI